MMQVKRYVAPSFAEALIKAKQELGTEALIVETRRMRVGGFLGFFGREMTELTAAVDQALPVKPPASARVPQPPAQAPSPGSPANTSGLEREVAGLRAAVARLVERGLAPAQGQNLKGFGRQVYDSLVARGVDEVAALDIGQRVGAEGGDGTDGPDQVRRELVRLLGPGAPIQVTPGKRRVVALIGPTGVGKTTTLAKLAAHFTLEHGLKVALVTSDTFRIAAIEQLRTYAEILGLPLYAVDSPGQVATAMKETAQYDLVLVDTGGRNHKDEVRMQELRDHLAIIRPDEIHLVFSLTANPRDVFEGLDYYLPLGVHKLTFTKLDEASAPGLMLNVRIRCSQPVSYVTCGQSVPDDILSADQVDLPKILLGV